MKQKLQLGASVLFLVLVLPIFTQITRLISAVDTLANILGFILLLSLGCGTWVAGRIIINELRSRLTQL